MVSIRAWRLRLRIPALALCLLHWADILRGHGPDEPDLEELCAPMLAVYNSAVAFRSRPRACRCRICASRATG